LLEEFRRRLTDEERQLADLRAQGVQCAEIADRLGGTPASRGTQLVRALDRVEQELEGSAPGDA
jgi:DNA-binding CsgD family transcriptional regulator